MAKYLLKSGSASDVPLILPLNFSVEELAHITEKQDAADLIFSLLESLRMNGRIKGTSEAEPDLRRYSAKS